MLIGLQISVIYFVRKYYDAIDTTLFNGETLSLNKSGLKFQFILRFKIAFYKDKII